MIRRPALVIYAVACYLFAVFTMLYGAGFMLNIAVPRSIDVGPGAPLAQALLIDLGLIALFGLQHSLMARPAVKAFLGRFVPAPAERSTYLLATSIAFSLFWFWRPLTAPIWQVELPAARLLLIGMFWLGLALVLVSTYLIDHFALLGLRQAYDDVRGRTTPEATFRTPSLYRYSRHPMMVGMLITFWATPEMTAGHLLFALGMSVYVLIGIAFEERDLLRHFGARYAAYRAQVPMLIPLPRRPWRRPPSERTP